MALITEKFKHLITGIKTVNGKADRESVCIQGTTLEWGRTVKKHIVLPYLYL